MNIDLKSLPSKLLPLLAILRRYLAIAFTVFLIGALAFLIYRINSLTSQEPTDDDVSQKLQTVSRPKIDQASIDKLQKLQDQNIQVQSLFEQARNNPFDE